MTDRPRFRFVVEALPSDRPAPIRLRAVLKYALRIQQLKCVEICEAAAPAAKAGDGEPVRFGGIW